MIRPYVAAFFALVAGAALTGCNLLGGPDYFVDDTFAVNSGGAESSSRASSGTGGAQGTGVSVVSSSSGGAGGSSGAGALCVKAECEKLDAVGDCFYSGCLNGTCANTLILAKDTPCASNGGKFCSGSDACVECTDVSQCAAGMQCIANFCQGSSCLDKMKNGAESGIDCGGPSSGCAVCGLGGGCLAATDCASKFCNAGTCASCSSAGDCSGVPEHYCSLLQSGVCMMKKGKFGVCLSGEECLSGKCQVIFCE